MTAKIETCGLDKVALVAKLATPETQHLYAEHVENMSTPALQAFTKEIRHGKPETPKMTIELDEEMQALFNQLKKKLAPNASNQEALKIILKSVSKDVFSKTSQPTQSAATPLPFRTISTKTRKTIHQKTNGKCPIPTAQNQSKTFTTQPHSPSIEATQSAGSRQIAFTSMSLLLELA